MTETAAAGKIALVTGATRGIGFEIARQLGERGVIVLLGARDEARGRAAVDALAGTGVKAVALRLDVTDEAGVARAAAQVREQYGVLDILVNNAGIAGGFRGAASLLPVEEAREVFETNVFGVIRVTGAMMPLLLRSGAGRIVNMSSHLGSLELSADPGSRVAQVGLVAYRSSKTVLNALTIAYANELRQTPIKVNSADPGMVATDLNHHRGDRTPQEGARIAVRLALLERDGPTGACLSEEGVVPW